MRLPILLTVSMILSLLLSSCGSEEGGRRRMDFSKIKPELKLSQDQENQFDTIIEKYNNIREEAKEAAKNDRSVMMEKMREIIKQQNAEIVAILEGPQIKKYNEFAKKFSRFGKPGYPDELMAVLKADLKLSENQSTMLEAVNKAFEKSYINAHDYYHGNHEAAREYWNKYDEERKKALQKVFSEEQYTEYLKLVEAHGFEGEHGKAESK